MSNLILSEMKDEGPLFSLAVQDAEKNNFKISICKKINSEKETVWSLAEKKSFKTSIYSYKQVEEKEESAVKSFVEQEVSFYSFPWSKPQQEIANEDFVSSSEMQRALEKHKATKYPKKLIGSSPENDNFFNHKILKLDALNALKFQKRTSGGNATTIPLLSSETLTEETEESDDTESEAKSFLGNKTIRSEASLINASSIKYQEITSNLPHIEQYNVDLKSKFDSNSCFETGRWSHAEHEVFIEALINHGKDWKKIKKHINSRGYFQIVQYTTRFFNRIRKLFDINFNLSFDSMNNFKKIINQQNYKNLFNQYPQCDLDSKNYAKARPKEQNIFMENLFFEIISNLKSSNFHKISKDYRSLVTNKIKAFFIKEFLVFNSYQVGNYFQTLKLNFIKNNKNKKNQKIKIKSHLEKYIIEGDINNPSHNDVFKNQNNNKKSNFQEEIKI